MTNSTASGAMDRLLAAGADPAAHAPGPAVGYVCSYVPEEIILAAGLHPVRLGARPGPTGPADSRLQSFSCSFARALLDGLLSGRWNGLEGFVFAYTCDSLRAAFESWRISAPPGRLVHFLNLPARIEGPGVLDYAASEMRRLSEALGGVDGAHPPTPDDLAWAIGLIGAVRQNLEGLARVRRARPDLLPGSTYMAMARGAAVLDRREAATLTAAVADELTAAMGATVSPSRTPSGAPPRPGGGRPRVLVLGGYLETEEPLRLIEESGADIVSDDLCLGGRRLEFGAGDDSDPYRRLAAMYLGRTPCPTKHPPDRRFEEIRSRATTDGVDGAIFLLQKFCDPHAFDYPALRDTLAEAGVPSLVIEVELGAVSTGQARTRLEAFIETLRQTARTSRGPGHPRGAAAGARGPAASRAGRGGGRM
ncbi:MAG: 2-hydroxyacyl-CoA dehydratase [Bacillota bacterium]|nr:MAG: 2-hydroxyacyl-CoA dehydratase [Bacillota bacterium]